VKKSLSIEVLYKEFLKLLNRRVYQILNWEENEKGTMVETEGTIPYLAERSTPQWKDELTRGTYLLEGKILNREGSSLLRKLAKICLRESIRGGVLATRKRRV